jgi:hypothetical protein
VLLHFGLEDLSDEERCRICEDLLVVGQRMNFLIQAGNGLPVSLFRNVCRGVASNEIAAVLAASAAASPDKVPFAVSSMMWISGTTASNTKVCSLASEASACLVGLQPL